MLFIALLIDRKKIVITKSLETEIVN